MTVERREWTYKDMSVCVCACVYKFVCVCVYVGKGQRERYILVIKGHAAIQLMKPFTSLDVKSMRKIDLMLKLCVRLT